MKDGRGLTKGLAIVGTGLVWLLLAATLSAPLAGFIPDDVGRLEYLVGAAMDLFPLVLLGGSLLLWAALRARSHTKAIAWGLAAPTASIAAGMIWSIAVPDAGWSWALTLTITAYWLGVAFVGAAGVSLTRALVTGQGGSVAVRGYVTDQAGRESA